jgi:hypothetical protein
MLEFTQLVAGVDVKSFADFDAKSFLWSWRRLNKFFYGANFIFG